MTKNKMAIIGTVGLPAYYGAFETLAEQLVEQLKCEWKISVYCSSKSYTKEQRKKINKDVKLIYLPVSANGMTGILYHCLSILHSLFYADVLLILGISGGFMVPFVRIFTRKAIVISIGSITWKAKKLSKITRLYLWAAEWMAVKFAHVNIADNESVQNYTTIRYKMRSNMIEYGADHIIKTTANAADKLKYPFLKTPYAFMVCNIDPENNISMILSAFSQMPKRPLVIIGNWNNSKYGSELRAQFATFPNITLLDPIYKERERNVLHGNSYIYLHGHSAGGTDPSLVEAMYLGLPVMAYGISYNKTTTEGKAIYFRSTEELMDLINNTKIIDLKKVAVSMKEIANRRYTWKIVADKYQYMLLKAMEISKKPKSANGNRPGKNTVGYDRGHLKSPALFCVKDNMLNHKI